MFISLYISEHRPQGRMCVLMGQAHPIRLASRELVPGVEALGAAVEAVSRQPWGEPWLRGGAAGGLWGRHEGLAAW